eukprot:gene4315-biopygen3502
MATFLRGRAAEFYDELPDDTDLDDLKTALIQQFMPKEARRFYYADLYGRKQGESESAADFGREIQQLVRRAHSEMPGEHQDTLMREHFLNGLRPELKRIVLISGPKSFARAVEVAKREEINEQVTRTFASPEARTPTMEERKPKPKSSLQRWPTHLQFLPTSRTYRVEMSSEERSSTAATARGRKLKKLDVAPHEALTGCEAAKKEEEENPRTFINSVDGRTCVGMAEVMDGKYIKTPPDNLSLVFERFKNEGLKLKPKKCYFCQPEVLYLGHVVGKDGIKPNPEKISVIQNYPVPKDCGAIRSFVALVSYYRQFIKNFASIAAPLNYLLKKGVKFTWSDDCQCVFEYLRNSLLKAPILTYPDFNERFSLYTDASNTGIGAVLAQNIGGTEKTIAYASRSLKPHERKYATIERECLALVWGIKYFRPYLYGHEFDVITDHNPLKWLDNARDPHSRLSRWSLSLQSYSYVIKHRPGRSHGNADALSRMPANHITPFVNAIDSPSLQLEEVRNKQRQDPALQDLINYFEKGEIPENSVCARRLMATADDYVFEDGLLYHLLKGRARTRDLIRKQLVIPRSLKDEVMLSMLEELTSGHLGFEKTYHRIQQRYFWTDSKPDFIPGDLGADITVNEEPENDNHSNEGESETDPAELEVRSILHKKIVKNRSGRKQTYYLVEWADDNIEPSWEPLSNLHCESRAILSYPGSP